MGIYQESGKELIPVAVGFVLKGILKRRGAIGLLMVVGDFIVKQTKTKEDDKMWKEVKKVLKKFV